MALVLDGVRWVAGRASSL